MGSRREFFFEHTVYLSDTNAMGNVYFARFFEWEGKAREEFFRQIIPDYKSFLQRGIKLITAEASMQYKHECLLFDVVRIQVTPSNVKHVSFELSFRFTEKTSGKLLGVGGQKIAFADERGKLIPIPDELVENGQYYLSDEEQKKVQLLFGPRKLLTGLAGLTKIKI